MPSAWWPSCCSSRWRPTVPMTRASRRSRAFRATVHNQIGRIGAWLADALFFVFGRPAFLFPVMLGAACWMLLRRMKGEPGSGSRVNTAVRICGFLLVLFASCGLTTLHWAPGVLRQSAGGIVGREIGENLSHGLGFLGATLLMLAAWMAGLSLAFHVSWLTVIDRLGAWAWAGVSWLRAAQGDRQGCGGRPRAQAGAQGSCQNRTEEVRGPRSDAHRSRPHRSSRRASGSRKSGRCSSSIPRSPGNCRR